MCKSKIKIAVCILGLLILACSMSHCSRKEGGEVNNSKKNIISEKAEAQKVVADLDGDGIADNQDEDIDGDGLTNKEEEALNSDPFNKDTDGDGKLDGEEAKKDTDKDGFLDIIESAKKDKDNDGVVDELDSDDSTTNNDSDNDGYSNIQEKKAGTNPLDPQSHPMPKDTDKDGKLDKDEKGKDSDHDNKSNVVESAKLDHDNDGVVDELDSDDANPANDSDGDGFSNIDEKNAGTNPLDKTSFPTLQKSQEEESNNTSSEAVGEESVEQTKESNSSVTKATEIQAVPQEVKQEIENKIADVLKVENIQFEVDSSTITPKGIETVKKIAEILRKYPKVKIEIGGHTDSDGEAAYNQKLSQERVDMVKKALIEFGLDGARFTTKGYGESKPLVPNDSQENKAKNRRVEFIIIGE